MRTNIINKIGYVCIAQRLSTSNASRFRASVLEMFLQTYLVVTQEKSIYLCKYIFMPLLFTRLCRLVFHCVRLWSLQLIPGWSDAPLFGGWFTCSQLNAYHYWCGYLQRKKNILQNIRCISSYAVSPAEYTLRIKQVPHDSCYHANVYAIKNVYLSFKYFLFFPKRNPSKS